MSSGTVLHCLTHVDGELCGPDEFQIQLLSTKRAHDVFDDFQAPSLNGSLNGYIGLRPSVLI